MPGADGPGRTFRAEKGGVTFPRMSATSVVCALGWAASMALAAGFLLDAPGVVRWSIAAVLLGSAVVATVRRPIDGLAFLPVTALLGPIVRVPVGPIQLHIGDAYLGLLVLIIAACHVTRPVAPSASRNLLLVASGLVLVSWMVSVDGGDSMVAVLGIVQLLAAYVLTLNVVQTRADVRYVLVSWVAAVGVGCVLVVTSYVQGRILLIGVDPDTVAEMGGRASMSVLFRATFFVAPFIFTLASALLLSLTFLLLDSAAGARRLCLLLLVPLFIITAMAMGNMSVLVGVVVGTCGMLLWSLRFPRVSRRTLGLAVGVAVVGLLVVAGVGQLVEGIQLFLLRERLSDTTSLQLRFAVWRNVVDYLGSTPKVFLVGLGPDISIRSVELPVLRELFLGSGIQQEAVDSSYLYVALNLGLPALAVALALAAGMLWRLSKLLVRSPDALAVCVWVTMVAWLVMSVTQQSGISKPVLYLAQALALGDRLPGLNDGSVDQRVSPTAARGEI